MTDAIIHADAPHPLTPPDCDLTDFPSMLLDHRRLLTSETWIEAAKTPRLGHALLSLWCESFQQIPAASLPDNDLTLLRFSMCPTAKEWAKVRERALSAWVKCRDGRLYHPVVAEKALEAWLEKLASRLSSGAGNAKRWQIPFDPAPIDGQMRVARTLLAALNPQSRSLTKKRTSGLPPASGGDPGGTTGGIPPGSQEKGSGREGKGSSLSEANASASTAAQQAAAFTLEQADAMTKEELWSAGKSLLAAAKVPAAQCGSFIGGLVKEFTAEVVIDVVRAAVVEVPADPRGWMRASCQTRVGQRRAGLNRQEAQESRNRSVADGWEPPAASSPGATS